MLFGLAFLKLSKPGEHVSYYTSLTTPTTAKRKQLTAKRELDKKFVRKLESMNESREDPRGNMVHERRSKHLFLDYVFILGSDSQIMQVCHQVTSLSKYRILFLAGEAKDKIQTTIQKITEYFQMNRLQLNVNKTEFIIYSKPSLQSDTESIALDINKIRIDIRISK